MHTHPRMLAHIHSTTQGANESHSLHSYHLSRLHEWELDKERKRGKEKRTRGSGYWIGAKEDNSDKMWKGCWFVSFYFLPPPAALSVRTGLVCKEGKEGSPVRGTQALQRSPGAADTHQSKSPPAMAWHHLSRDLDWLVPKTSHPFQTSPNEF